MRSTAPPSDSLQIAQAYPRANALLRGADGPAGTSGARGPAKGPAPLSVDSEVAWHLAHAYGDQAYSVLKVGAGCWRFGVAVCEELGGGGSGRG